MKSTRILLLLTLTALVGCETMDQTPADRAALQESIRQEAPGDYFIGRRFYKVDYKMWGWVREPGKPWSTAKLVMFNEQQKLAPDRQANDIGSDNGYEYRLMGGYSGDTVYEPASNRFYPEFVLTGYELKSARPPMIFKENRSLDPKVRLLTAPL